MKQIKEYKKNQKPIILSIEDISRAGMITVSFNQELKIPYFMHNLTIETNKTRKLN